MCSKLEFEISKLPEEDKPEMLSLYDLSESGLNILAKAAFQLLDIQTFLTTGPKETHAWTIKKGMTAPQAAGVIHTDFESNFIRANVIKFEDIVENNGWKQAQEKGLLKQEGKDYILSENDVVEFLTSALVIFLRTSSVDF